MAIIQVQVSQEDVDKAAKGGGGVMPIGKYRLRIESKEWSPPKSADKSPMIVCKCLVLQSFNGQNLGKTITRRFVMSPKSIPYNIARYCKAAGIPFQYTPQGAFQFDDDHLLGATTDVECKHTAGEQRTFEEWENDTPIDGAAQAAPQMNAPQMAPQGYAAPQGGWTPPGQQQGPAQNFAPPQGWVPPGQPVQQPMQPQYAPPAQHAVQAAQQLPYNPQQVQQPAPGGAPSWMQPQQAPVPQQAYPQQYAPQQPQYAPQNGQHVAGQGPMPPRGQG